MKIYSMTATFGKLENQTLTLQPGLNILSAPNEWGKSTWCAFLATMLYGLDTREKTTKTALAAKERYAPWSGAPMSGRIELAWNEKNITIERWTKGRTPMGEFKAYETESGLAVPELTSANCGEMLLGVEKSVFLRAGFLRLADLPVTADESLRRRLNALVTTGDESGAADELGQKLKDLKNKCRFNRTGLLPQAEAQKQALEEKRSRLLQLQQQSQAITQQQAALESRLELLKNHEKALEYDAAEEHSRRIAQAQLRRDAAKAQLDRLSAQCETLPDQNQAKQVCEQLRQLHQQSMALDLEQQMLPQPPQQPACRDAQAARAALEQAKEHSEHLQNLNREYPAAKRLQRIALIFLLATIPAVLIGWLASQSLWVTAAITAVPLLVGIVLFLLAKGTLQENAAQIRNLEAMYGSLDSEQWVRQARQALEAQAAYAKAQEVHEATLSAFRARREALATCIQTLTQGQPIGDCLQGWETVTRKWEELAEARRVYEDAKDYAETAAAMAKPTEKPAFADELTYSALDTQRFLAEGRLEAQRLQLRLGQYQGSMDALGSVAALESQLEAVNARIKKLNLTYNALELAQKTLENATAELQRRFAPRIAEAAREIFAKLTGGRYDRLNLTQELTVNTATAEDVSIRSVQWRSDGTIDQLYLALRLAVARELTPDAPLILDDALVRFDDSRHAAAMEILRQESAQKQILLFTCQSREQ